MGEAQPARVGPHQPHPASCHCVYSPLPCAPPTHTQAAPQEPHHKGEKPQALHASRVSSGQAPVTPGPSEPGEKETEHRLCCRPLAPIRRLGTKSQASISLLDTFRESSDIPLLGAHLNHQAPCSLQHMRSGFSPQSGSWCKLRLTGEGTDLEGPMNSGSRARGVQGQEPPETKMAPSAGAALSTCPASARLRARCAALSGRNLCPAHSARASWTKGQHAEQQNMQEHTDPASPAAVVPDGPEHWHRRAGVSTVAPQAVSPQPALPPGTGRASPSPFHSPKGKEKV